MDKSLILAVVTFVAVGISLIADASRTWRGLQKGAKMLLNLLPHFLVLIILVSVFLWLMPHETLVTYLGKESGALGVVIAACLGAMALIPGPIAYPLSGILLGSGVSYMVIAVFITTLMMVGILTLPVEAKYFGIKLSLIRNILSLIGAVLIGVIVGGLL